MSVPQTDDPLRTTEEKCRRASRRKTTDRHDAPYPSNRRTPPTALATDGVLADDLMPTLLTIKGQAESPVSKRGAYSLSTVDTTSQNDGLSQPLSNSSFQGSYNSQSIYIYFNSHVSPKLKDTGETPSLSSGDPNLSQGSDKGMNKNRLGIRFPRLGQEQPVRQNGGKDGDEGLPTAPLLHLTHPFPKKGATTPPTTVQGAHRNPPTDRRTSSFPVRGAATTMSFLPPSPTTAPPQPRTASTAEGHPPASRKSIPPLLTPPHTHSGKRSNTLLHPRAKERQGGKERVEEKEEVSMQEAREVCQVLSTGMLSLPGATALPSPQRDTSSVAPTASLPRASLISHTVPYLHNSNNTNNTNNTNTNNTSLPPSTKKQSNKTYDELPRGSLRSTETNVRATNVTNHNNNKNNNINNNNSNTTHNKTLKECIEIPFQPGYTPSPPLSDNPYSSPNSVRRYHFRSAIYDASGNKINDDQRLSNKSEDNSCNKNNKNKNNNGERKGKGVFSPNKRRNSQEAYTPFILDNSGQEDELDF